MLRPQPPAGQPYRADVLTGTMVGQMSGLVIGETMVIVIMLRMIEIDEGQIGNDHGNTTAATTGTGTGTVSADASVKPESGTEIVIALVEMQQAAVGAVTRVEAGEARVMIAGLLAGTTLAMITRTAQERGEELAQVSQRPQKRTVDGERQPRSQKMMRRTRTRMKTMSLLQREGSKSTPTTRRRNLDRSGPKAHRRRHQLRSRRQLQKQ
mmetsp:Transcript_25223/g.58034  ORF Transcript_25223/g.58034 Transcript_25223/m.58034 type:complete len:210 (+) Transcript_25223:931-1560(+)